MYVEGRRVTGVSYLLPSTQWLSGLVIIDLAAMCVSVQRHT
jgi:hypothetical protein